MAYSNPLVPPPPSFSKYECFSCVALRNKLWSLVGNMAHVGTTALIYNYPILI